MINIFDTFLINNLLNNRPDWKMHNNGYSGTVLQMLWFQKHLIISLVLWDLAPSCWKIKCWFLETLCLDFRETFCLLLPFLKSHLPFLKSHLLWGWGLGVGGSLVHSLAYISARSQLQYFSHLSDFSQPFLSVCSAKQVVSIFCNSWLNPLWIHPLLANSRKDFLEEYLFSIQ